VACIGQGKRFVAEGVDLQVIEQSLPRKQDQSTHIAAGFVNDRCKCGPSRQWGQTGWSRSQATWVLKSDRAATAVAACISQHVIKLSHEGLIAGILPRDEQTSFRLTERSCCGGLGVHQAILSLR
jgi:hypothetical protein